MKNSSKSQKPAELENKSGNESPRRKKPGEKVEPHELASLMTDEQMEEFVRILLEKQEKP